MDSSIRLFFLDVECLHDNSRVGLFIKELSVFEYKSKRVSTFHFFPPKTLVENNLSEKAKGANNYLKRHRHGFGFNSGLLGYDRLKFIAHSLFAKKGFKYILFVKGQQKIDLLSQSLTHSFPVHYVDLESLGCPKYVISEKSAFTNCLLFSSKLEHLHKYCSESKVQYFADWFQRLGIKVWERSEITCQTCGEHISL